MARIDYLPVCIRVCERRRGRAHVLGVDEQSQDCKRQQARIFDNVHRVQVRRVCRPGKVKDKTSRQGLTTDIGSEQPTRRASDTGLSAPPVVARY